MEAIFSRLKEGDLFGLHHSVICILNRVGIGKSRHRFEIREEDLFGCHHLVDPLNPKWGWTVFRHQTGDFHPAPPPYEYDDWQMCVSGTSSKLSPCQAHSVWTIKYRGSLSSRPRLTMLWSQILNNPTNFWTSEKVSNLPGLRRDRTQSLDPQALWKVIETVASKSLQWPSLQLPLSYETWKVRIIILQDLCSIYFRGHSNW